MATINASTTIKVKKPSVGVGKAGGKSAGTKKGIKGKGGASGRRGSVAPPLKPVALASRTALLQLRSKDDEGRRQQMEDLFRKALGENVSVRDISTPHAASTSRDRAGAAADVAAAAKELGLPFVLKRCGALNEMQRMLFPQGIEALLPASADSGADTEITGGIKASASAVSLTSLVDEMSTASASANSGGTDSKRGKTTPPNAREGCLLIIRALCEIVGKPAEPYLVGAFLAAALDECASSSSSIREAAEDASTALVSLAHPWAFPSITCPLLLTGLKSSEWRVKAAALERLEQCSVTAPVQVQRLIPTLIPAITNQVWDTKAQVSKGARSALLAICKTNDNKDIRPTIPAVVNAICKPAETNKAVSELMGTTFVVPVGASTLAILCPVLARALKEKLAIHKRAACIVISNMSKLVDTPSAVAPFGSLLVPELQKVATNVQFEEIRDEALKALANLTKALGSMYNAAAATQEGGAAENSSNDNKKVRKELQQETARVEAEQERIRAERDAQSKREEELREREEEERRKFKEAMNAQRELNRLAAEEAEKKKQDEEKKREAQKLSTKTTAGKCQSCGLKRCKKSCMFYSGK